MAREFSNHLSELIGALTKSEKIYFKKRVKLFMGREQGIYTDLFDAYCRPGKPDEQLISRQLQKKYKEQNLSRKKNYLYHLVLEYTREFNAERNSDFKFKNELAKLELLKDRGLLKQSSIYFRRIKREAAKADYFLGDVEFFAHTLHDMRINHNLSGKEMLRHYIEWKERVNEKFDMIAILNLVISLHIKTSNAGTYFLPPDLTDYFNGKTKLHTDTGRFFFYRTRFDYHYMQGEYKQALFYGEQLRAFYMKSPEVVKQHYKYYINTLFWTAVGYLREKKYPAGDRIMNHLRALQRINKGKWDTEVKKCTYLYHIRKYMQIGDYPQLAKTSEEFLKDPGLVLLQNNYMHAYFGKFIAYFQLNDFNSSYKALKNIEGLEQTNAHLFNKAFLYLFMLLLSFRYKKTGLLNIYLKKASLFLAKNRAEFSVLAQITEWIKKINLNKDRGLIADKDEKNKLKAAVAEILKKDSPEKIFATEVNLIKLIESI